MNDPERPPTDGTSGGRRPADAALTLSGPGAAARFGRVLLSSALLAAVLLGAACGGGDAEAGGDPSGEAARGTSGSGAGAASRQGPAAGEGAAPACPRLPPDALGRLDTLATEDGDDEPIRVILLVGDGVGAGYWTAVRLVRPRPAPFALPVVGFTDTRNARGRVTDSAASATALASGCLTYNRSIGMGPDTTAIPTVLEAARRRGLATGLVSTSRVTHATPAAFAAHVADRGEEEQIALQITDFGLDVLMGGGRDRFRAEDRNDGQDLVRRLRQGRTYVESAGGLDSILATSDPDGRADGAPARGRATDTQAADDPSGAADGASPAADDASQAPVAGPGAAGDPAAGLVALLADGHLPPAPEREVSLAAMTRAALQTLDRDPDGFFLVVEAAQPDWRGHRGASLDAVQAEMLDLDDAVRAAREYRDDRPETLLVVASDHETGGLAVVQEGDRLAERWAHTGSVSVRDHTANLVAHFAAGPGADALRGIQTPASIGWRLMETVAGEALVPAAER